MVLEKILEVSRGRGRVASPQMNLGQEELRVREMRGIDLPGLREVLLRQVHFPESEVCHAELRIGQSVVGTRQYRIHVVLPGLIEVVQINQHTTEVDQR